jgi:DNA polymerase elongation subunit (family B)
LTILRSDFYTSVHLRRNDILLRGYQNGKRVAKKVPYKPYVFVPSQKESKYRTLDGQVVDKVDFGSISEAKEFLAEYKNVSNFPIYGLTDWPYLFIHDKYPGEIDFEQEAIAIGILDIEVEHDDGFPTPERADKTVTAITIRHHGCNHVFGYKDYISTDKFTRYKKCADEKELLTEFLLCWRELDLDIVTGWNVEGFDIPYLINRLDKVLGEGAHKMLSPWEQITDRTGFDGKVIYEIYGISVLDYLPIYKKFSFKTLESYRLDDVSMEELGEGKLDFGESSTLAEMYVRDFQRFIDYNIIDCVRVEQIESKMGLIELICARAYDAKCRFSDCLGTVKLWDTLIHYFLLDEKNVVIPPFKPGVLDKKLIGGFNKDIIPGEYRWVIGIDVRSEYPHTIMQWNISPETILDRASGKFAIYNEDVNPIIFEGGLSEYVRDGYCIAANGYKFANDKPGFLAELMDKLFTDRQKYQKLLKEAKKAGEKKLISKYHNKQRALKDTLNSGYGALANQYFRWFNFNMAEAITSSGQFIIRSVAMELNKYFNKLYGTKDKDFIVASDTDSLYINAGPLVDRVFPKGASIEKTTNMLDKFCKEQMLPHIDKVLIELASSTGCKRNRIVMNRETISDKGIWTAKKHYILNVRDEEGFRPEEPKLKIVGIQCVQSSTPMVVREAIRKSLFMIMNGTKEEYQNYVKDFKSEFESLPFEKIAFPRSVSGLKKYGSGAQIFSKGAPIQVKGALLYNFLLKKHKLDKKLEAIQEGNKLRFTYLREPNPMHCNVIASPGELPPQFGLDKFIDRDLQFEKAFVDPMSKITDAIGWEILQTNNATLSDFFA